METVTIFQKKINVTIQIVLSLKNTAQEKNATQLTVKLSKQQDFFPVAFFIAKMQSLHNVRQGDSGNDGSEKENPEKHERDLGGDK